MVKLSYTYEIVTPESAEDGEAAEHGWWMPGGWQHPLQDENGHHESVLDEAKAGAFDHMVRAAECVRDLGGFECTDSHPDCSRGKVTLYEVDETEDYSTGARTRRAAHLEADPRLLRAILRALED